MSTASLDSPRSSGWRNAVPVVRFFGFGKGERDSKAKRSVLPGGERGSVEAEVRSGSKRRSDTKERQRGRDNLDAHQMKIFTRWWQAVLPPGSCVRNLCEDIQNGLLVIQLLEILTGETIPNVTRKELKSTQANTFAVLANFEACLQFCDSRFGMKFLNIDAKSLAKGDRKQVLAFSCTSARPPSRFKPARCVRRAAHLVWLWPRRPMNSVHPPHPRVLPVARNPHPRVLCLSRAGLLIQKFELESLAGGTVNSSSAELLETIRTIVSRYEGVDLPGAGKHVWESGFKDGSVLAAIVDAGLAQTSVGRSSPFFARVRTLPVRDRLDAVFAAGTRRGAPRLLDSTDFTGGDASEQAVRTYVSFLQRAMGDDGHATRLQSAVRGFVARRRYSRMRRGLSATPAEAEEAIAAAKRASASDKTAAEARIAASRAASSPDAMSGDYSATLSSVRSGLRHVETSHHTSGEFLHGGDEELREAHDHLHGTISTPEGAPPVDGGAVGGAAGGTDAPVGASPRVRSMQFEWLTSRVNSILSLSPTSPPPAATDASPQAANAQAKPPLSSPQTPLRVGLNLNDLGTPPPPPADSPPVSRREGSFGLARELTSTSDGLAVSSPATGSGTMGGAAAGTADGAVAAEEDLATATPLPPSTAPRTATKSAISEISEAATATDATGRASGGGVGGAAAATGVSASSSNTFLLLSLIASAAMLAIASSILQPGTASPPLPAPSPPPAALAKAVHVLTRPGLTRDTIVSGAMSAAGAIIWPHAAPLFASHVTPYFTAGARAAAAAAAHFAAAVTPHLHVIALPIHVAARVAASAATTAAAAAARLPLAVARLPAAAVRLRSHPIVTRGYERLVAVVLKPAAAPPPAAVAMAGRRGVHAGRRVVVAVAAGALARVRGVGAKALARATPKAAAVAVRIPELLIEFTTPQGTPGSLRIRPTRRVARVLTKLVPTP